MPFAIITRDKPGHADLRAELQSEHKRYLDRHCPTLLLAAGAMLDDRGENAHGGILIVDTDDRRVAEEFVENDPFARGGLFESVHITRWRKAFYDFERLVDLD